jgi:hypothetical protein
VGCQKWHELSQNISSNIMPPLSGFDIICFIAFFYNNFKPSGLSNKNMFEYQHKNPEGMLLL